MRRPRRLAAIALGAAALLLPLSACSTSEPSIELHVPDGPFEPIELALTGLQPGSEATLRAESAPGRVPHVSEAVFAVGDDGRVELADDAPVDGDWSTADPFAPFWSLHAEQGEVDPWAWEERHEVELSLEVDGRVVDRAVVERGIDVDGLVVEQVREDGLIGTFAAPAGLETAKPALLVFGGSEGGLAAGLALQLAALGHPALAISYFGMPGQPPRLEEVPVEPFLAGLDWLRDRPEADPDRIIAFGVSRGGEMALWLAADRPELVHGAIAPVGAGELWCGYPDGGKAAWTLDGEPLPCTAGAVEPASAIDVAAIAGPVVLACGTADALWPSCELMQRTAERRAPHAAPGDAAVHGEGAGHFLTASPYSPAFPGDDPAADAQARAAFWAAVVEALAVASGG